MTRTSFLVGISAIALVAGTASAQTTTSDSASNVRTVNCAAGDPANTCTVNNSTTYNPVNSNNTGTASALGGTGNNASVNQNGNNNSGSVGFTGSNNSGSVNQGASGGEVNNVFGQIQSTGTLNSATISQGSGSYTIGGQAPASSATGGNNNSATITQSGNAVAATTFVGGTAGNEGLVIQGASNNRASISQARTPGAADATGGNLAVVAQAYSTGGAGGTSNSGTVTQSGTNLTAVLSQDGSGTFAANNNRGVIAQTGLGSVGQIVQSSSGDSATVTVGGGDVAATAVNQAGVSQANNRFDATGGGFADVAPTAAFSSNNQANVAIIGLQNAGIVQQNGVNNSATVSVLGGGVGNTGGTPSAGFPANRPEGNQSSASQTGRGNYYNISAGGATSTNPNGGRGNSSTVTQGDGVSAPSNVSNARNMRATVYQRGTADTVAINQQNTLAGATVQSGSSVDVSQLSTVGSATINQNGTNSASVTQGLNADNSGGFQTLNLNQTDYGSVTIPGSGADPFGGPTGTRTANVAAIAQYGDTNQASVTQESINASATLFQARLSDNNAVAISQGTGDANANVGAVAGNGGTQATSNNLTLSVTQTGSGGTTFARQDGTNSNMTVNQGGTDNLIYSYQVSSFNSSTINQTGEDQEARIEQGATNGSASRRNLATVTQSGDTQYAAIFQAASAGASAAGSPASGPAGGSPLYPNARAAGANSAEAVIIQTNSRNSASITQNGLGQYARIEQNGILNSGTITQDAAATNAVAILEQNGNGNTYTIAQGAGDAGAYTRVQQTGNSNALISTTTFGTGATGAGNGAGVPNPGPF